MNRKKQRQIEKIGIIKEKYNMSKDFTMDFELKKVVNGIEKDVYILTYKLNRINFEIISRGVPYTRREILGKIGEELKLLSEIEKFEISNPEYLKDWDFVNRKETLIIIQKAFRHLFRDDYEKYYYLYAENFNVGKTSNDW